jgi:hypothetical protein
MSNYITLFQIYPNTQTYQKLIPATKQVKTLHAIINLILFLVLFYLVNVEELQTYAKKENGSLWLSFVLFSGGVV